MSGRSGERLVVRAAQAPIELSRLGAALLGHAGRRSGREAVRQAELLSASAQRLARGAVRGAPVARARRTGARGR
ncbi:MAG TPA: hypothetical protein VLA98_15655 [Solirubrobacteraceae bacterium]|nr:hypothetical protein [Solirubrobacteraceae bacterium]HSD80246.1 hypothetical protein [Solirubrobacteraceae bacterium]